MRVGAVVSTLSGPERRPDVMGLMRSRRQGAKITYCRSGCEREPLNLSRRSSVDLVAAARVAGTAGFQEGDRRDAGELAPAFPDGALTHTAFLGHVADARSLVVPSLEVVRGVGGELDLPHFREGMHYEE